VNKLSKEELARVTELASLELSGEEADAFARQLTELLTYTEEITSVSLSTELEAAKNINVFREDKAVRKPSDRLMAQAPETHDGYFIVPNILD
jgi:aspartyl/glutamyl-tRNA(Asn/Gln) amidotransferase C subunit